MEIREARWKLLVSLLLPFFLLLPEPVVLLTQRIKRGQMGVVVPVELVIERGSDVETRTGRPVKGLRTS